MNKRILRIVNDGGDVSQAAIDPARLLAGTPIGKTAHQFTNGAGNFHVGIWESDTGKWTVNYTEDEFCYIIEGCAVLTDSDGHAEEMQQGDAFVVPSGFAGSWETKGFVKKFYVIYE